jgi:hypothetical protein
MKVRVKKPASSEEGGGGTFFSDPLSGQGGILRRGRRRASEHRIDHRPAANRAVEMKIIPRPIAHPPLPLGK